MIKFDGVYKIKDTPRPTIMEIGVESGILYNTSQKNKVISLLPGDYLPGGSKSTGFLNKDIFNYTCDILDEIDKECFFNINIPKENEMKETYRKVAISSGCDKDIIDKLDLPFRDKLTADYVRELDRSSLFNIRITSVNDDIFLPCQMTPEHKFYLLFDLHYKKIDSLENKYNKLYFNDDCYNSNFSLSEFINILYNVFMFFYSQSVRDLRIAGAMHFIKRTYKKTLKEIECWDNKYKNYFPCFPIQLSPSERWHTCNFFQIPLICNLKGYTHNNYCNEVMNRIDYIAANSIINEKHEEVFITKTLENEFFQHIGSMENVFRIVGYLPYRNNYQDEVVSLSLYGRIKSSISAYKYVNVLGYSPEPFYELDALSPDGMLQDISYKDVLLDNSVKELFDKDLIEIYCDVCYYTDKKTNIPYKDLINKNIPKPRRDYLYKIFCTLCNEMNISPLKVKNNININFLKYYNDDLIGG